MRSLVIARLTSPSLPFIIEFRNSNCPGTVILPLLWPILSVRRSIVGLLSSGNSTGPDLITSTVRLSVTTGLKRDSVSLSIFTLSGLDRKQDVGTSLSSTLALELYCTKGVVVSSLFPSFILGLKRTCELSASSTFSSLGPDRK